MNNLASPIFVGGLMKSGTSLLRKLLTRHPHIFGGLETHWFSDEFQSTWRNPTAKRQVWLREFFGVDLVTSEAIRARATTATDYFRQLMDHCTVQAGKMRWVEKTPDNIFHLQDILSVWPLARLIHVVRDPRDTYASWRANGKGTIDDFVAQCERLADALERQSLNGEQFRTEPYEDLVRHPGRALRDLFGWLQEPWIEDLERYEGDSWDFDKILQVTGKPSPTAASLARPIFTDSIGRWRRELEQDTTELLQARLPSFVWGWCVE